MSRSDYRNSVFYLIAITFLLAIAGCKTDNVVSYPALPGCDTSEIYKVTVEGKRIWTEKFRTSMEINKLPSWFTSEDYTQVQQEIHIVNFSSKGRISVVINAIEPIDSAYIRPVSRGIIPHIEGKRLEFTLPGPDKLYIEINDLPPLCFFANPAETEHVNSGDAMVRYFGPGVHKPGMMDLKDNDVLYLAGGALVYGGIRVKNASNIRIMGRGILDGGFEHQRMVLLEDGKNIRFNGVIIRNGRSWTNTVVNCRDVSYQDVKVLSFGPGGDGINPLGTQKMLIKDCFFRCTDDCIAIKSPDSTHVVKEVIITNNTMIGYAFSDGVTIGFETNGPSISDVTVRNCDILMARGGSRVDGHSAFSIICDGPAIIHDILYEDLRVEERVLKLFELHITDGTKYGINPPGRIRNIHLKNISWASPKPIILKGFDESHSVENVTFEDCVIANEPLNDTGNEVFEIGDFVDQIYFK